MTGSEGAARKVEQGDRGTRELPEIRPWLLAFFHRYNRGYLRRHFHALRLSRTGRPPRSPAGDVSPARAPSLAEEPLVIYLNHPSWWDPLVALFLAGELFGDRRSYGPIEGRAVERYGLFRHLGFFGVDRTSTAGVRRFLETAAALLERPDTALWITPEGRFTDPRERPVRLEPGLAHLARRLHRGVFLPLAVELPFWEERTPEVLVRFGEPVPAAELGGRVGEINSELAARLERTQDALAEESRERREAAFEVLLSGRAGVGGVYDLWRSLVARLRGEPFQAEHGRRGHGERKRGRPLRKDGEDGRRDDVDALTSMR